MDETERERLAILAAELELTLPEPCVAGVLANRVLLAEHAARLHDFPLPGDPEA